MHYQDRDRIPICDFGFWPETIDAWHKQGLPQWVTYAGYNPQYTDPFFGMDTYSGGPTPNVGLCPDFGWKVLEDHGDHELIQQGDGVIVYSKKVMGSIPHHVAHTLVDRESWLKHYKPKLDPTHPERFPRDWSKSLAYLKDENRKMPCAIHGGSIFGWLRDWMGIENLALVVYDEPAWFEEMVETLADVIVYNLEKVLSSGAKYDSCNLWEDMCYSGGPLLSPEHFKRVLVPQYKRITEVLYRYGVDVIFLDCDGKIDLLIPHWMEAGINCMFPIEVGTWGADPVKYRKEYGKDLLMIGGFDKHILQGQRRAIRDEVERLAPLVEEGGFIPLPDHRVPPDVPYENYLYYLSQARRVWGKGSNLKDVTWEAPEE